MRNLSRMTAAVMLPDLRTGKPAVKIGACDWSIGGLSKVEALQTARKIGLDGVQVSLGTLANNMQLRRPEIQQQYREMAAGTGVEIGGLAIGELNNIPYKSDPRTEEWVSDSIEVAQQLGCKVILLAFFGKGDLKNDDAGQKEVIRRLRKVAAKAEKADVILGIESWLSAREHMALLDAVGSSHVKVYYDVANATQMGYDIYEEIPFLHDRIAEIHMKENGALLGKGVVDFERVRRVVQEIGYQGWLPIEGAVPKGADMLESYTYNAAYLRKLFSND